MPVNYNHLITLLGFGFVFFFPSSFIAGFITKCELCSVYAMSFANCKVFLRDRKRDRLEEKVMVCAF